MRCGVTRRCLGDGMARFDGRMGKFIRGTVQDVLLAVPQDKIHFEVKIRSCSCQEMMMARGQAVHKLTDMESGGRILVPFAI